MNTSVSAFSRQNDRALAIDRSHGDVEHDQRQQEGQPDHEERERARAHLVVVAATALRARHGGALPPFSPGKPAPPADRRQAASTPNVRAVGEIGTASLSGNVRSRWSAVLMVTPNQYFSFL